MTQHQIDLAHRRSMKTKYKHLKPEEKRYVKLVEKERMLKKAFYDTLAYIGRCQPPPYLPENTPPHVLDAWDRSETYRKQLIRVRRSMDKLVEKHGLDTDMILHVHMQYNLAPGGSF